jgi:hypothetical protein
MRQLYRTSGFPCGVELEAVELGSGKVRPDKIENLLKVDRVKHQRVNPPAHPQQKLAKPLELLSIVPIVALVWLASLIPSPVLPETPLSDPRGIESERLGFSHV